MAERHIYQVRAQEVRTLILELNNIFLLLMDRLDKMEGIRGNPEFYADAKFRGNSLLDVATPTATTDGVNKSYVDSNILGGLSTANPIIVGGATPAPGTGTRSSKDDHKHALDIMTGALRGGAKLGTGVEITSTDVLRVIPSAATPTTVQDGTASAGTGTTPAREDHQHPLGIMAAGVRGGAKLGTGLEVHSTDVLRVLLSSASPTTVQDGTASAGTGTTPSREDHQHSLALMSATVRGGAKLGTGLQLTGGGSDTLGVKQQTGEADVAVTANIDGADTVAKATVLSALNALENKVNALITKLEGAETLATI